LTLSGEILRSRS